MVQDYCYINKFMIKNNYLLPLISQLVDKLKGCKLFTKWIFTGAITTSESRKATNSSSSMTSMLPSTSSCLRQGPTHVTDTGRCPTPCPNPTEVARLGQLSLCCSRSGTSPSSWACSVLFPVLQLSRTAVCAATKLSVRCSQDPSDLRTFSVLYPDWQGELVVTQMAIICSTMNHTNYSGDMSTMISGSMINYIP